MKKLVLILLSTLIIGCAKNRLSDTQIVENIYKTIIKAELQKNKTVAVVDQSANNTYLDLEAFTSLYGEKDSVFHLKPSSFKDIKLINSDSLRMYATIRKEKNISFQEFIPSYTSGKIMMISIPFFNKDKSKAITEIIIGNPITEKFYTRYYVLEKKGATYAIINTRTLNSSGNVVDENYKSD